MDNNTTPIVNDTFTVNIMTNVTGGNLTGTTVSSNVIHGNLTGSTVLSNVTDGNLTGTTTITVATTVDDKAWLTLLSSIVPTAILLLMMLGMGATIEIPKLLGHLRRPLGAGIGLLAQFIVLPLVTFGLAHLLQLEAGAAIGMLIMSSCPGGALSNLFAYWADGDVPLSLTMTTISTLVAFGAMPLNIWIYSRSWSSKDFVIPYVNLVTALAFVIVPTAIGIFIKWKWEKIAPKLVKIGSWSGGIGAVAIVILMSIQYPYIYAASSSIYLAAFLLSFIGFTLGYVLAKLFRMNSSCARTIALETSIQNFTLCLTVITLSFSKELVPKLVLFPILYPLFCIANSGIFVYGYKAIKMFKTTADDVTQTHHVVCKTFTEFPNGMVTSIAVQRGIYIFH